MTAGLYGHVMMKRPARTREGRGVQGPREAGIWTFFRFRARTEELAA
jgi:hypothetical protein